MTKHKNTVLGIDIGGTKISLIIGDHEQGLILAREKFLLNPNESPEISIERIFAFYRSLLKQCDVRDNEIEIVSIGCPGSCDYKNGIALKFPNMPHWSNFDIKKALQKFLKNKSMRFDNDANCAALGEKCFGAGKKFSDFLYITVSTGVGGGLILNNTMYRGKSHDAGEFGHMTVVQNGDVCGCGKRGCLEAYASGSSLARRGGVKDVPALLEEMKRGNKNAERAYHEGIQALAIGIGNSLQLLNLEAVIIGGGVARIGDSYVSELQNAVRTYTWPGPYEHCMIMPTSLRDEVVDYGTLALARFFV